MKEIPHLILVHRRHAGDAVELAAITPGLAETGEEGRASLGSLLVLLPVMLGSVLMAKPLFYGLLHWSSAAYALGAVLSFLIAARWLVQMRETPCLSCL